MGFLMKFVISFLLAFLVCFGAGGVPIGLVQDMTTFFGTTNANLFVGIVVLLGIVGNVIHEVMRDGL